MYTRIYYTYNDVQYAHARYNTIKRRQNEPNYCIDNLKIRSNHIMYVRACAYVRVRAYIIFRYIYRVSYSTKSVQKCILNYYLFFLQNIIRN